MSDSERMARLQAVIAQLESIGMKVGLEHEWRGPVGPERKPHDIAVVSSVDLGFSLEDWARLTRNDGPDYVGGCCGNMSAVQDIVSGWWRFEESRVSVRELQEVAEAMRDHDCSDTSIWVDDIIPRIPETIRAHLDPNIPEKLPPWSRIAIAWHMLKDFFDLSKEYHVAGMHLSDAEKALSTVGRSAFALSVTRAFGRSDRESANHPGSRAADLLIIAKVRPALVALLKGLDELAGGPVDGYAIESIRNPGKDAPGPAVWDIAENGRGLAIFATREEAEEVVQSNLETSAQYEEHRERLQKSLRVRAVRVESDGTIVWKEPAPEGSTNGSA